MSDSPPILFLDPSSTRTGYAVFHRDDQLIDAGLLKPERERDEPNVRIAAMTQDVLNLAREHGVNTVVIEDTSGKVSKRHGGGGAGLATYGKMIGYLMGVLRMKGFDVVTVLENDWTAGTKKMNRQLGVAATFKGYSAEKDPGMDVSDAVALGQWWLARHGRKAG